MIVTDQPSLRVLSLGAGVQSTTLALLAAEGTLPGLDLAVFADTGWEPRKVYRHLDRVEQALAAIDVPVVRVSQGDLRADSLTGTSQQPSFVRLPLFVRGADGRASMLNRQCTERYKIEPIKREIRRRLGARTSRTGAVLRPPADAVAEQWIGFSTDEIERVTDRAEPYLRNRHPLLELGMSRSNCIAWLERRGWGDTPKSACVGCMYHGNRAWRELRDGDPEEWVDAVAFDRRIRELHAAGAVRGPRQPPYLHRSLTPLDEADIESRQRKDAREDQGDLFDVLEHGAPGGCSPHGCRSGERAS